MKNGNARIFNFEEAKRRIKTETNVLSLKDNMSYFKNSKVKPANLKNEKTEVPRKQQIKPLRTENDEHSRVPSNLSNNKINQILKQNNLNDQKVSDLDNYSLEKIVGSGTFGKVFLAKDKKTQQQVAIKKVLQDPKYKNRELDILKLLHHPNLISLHKAFYV